MDRRPKTLFLDIDGVLVRHGGTLADIWWNAQQLPPTDLLPGVREKFQEWDQKGYRIILTTGRRECMRPETERQLRAFGLGYDLLLMGLGGGPRVVINDRKPTGEVTALAVDLERNAGLEGVDL